MNDEETSYFLDAVFLANTPSFLLGRTLANPRLDAIISKYGADDLVTTLLGGDAPDATLTRRAAAYVALVALVKSGSRRIDDFRLWTPVRLTWAPAIIAEWDLISRATAAAKLNFSPAISVADAGRSASASSTSNLNFGGGAA